MSNIEVSVFAEVVRAMSTDGVRVEHPPDEALGRSREDVRNS